MKTDRQAEAQRLQQKGLTRAEAAKAMGLKLSGYCSLLERAAKWDDAPSALTNGAQVIGADTPANIVWTKTHKDGSTTHSVMHSNKPEPPDPEEYAEAMVERFKDIPPAPAVHLKESPVKDTMALFIVADWHLGASSTKEETGNAYNRKIAVERLRDGFSTCHAATAPSEFGIVLFNGDTTDADNDKRETPRSGHKLMVEGSHQSNLLLAEESADWSVQMALERHEKVIFSAKRGNHDPHTPPTLIAGMRARYADNPRVTVIEDEEPFFMFQHKKLFFVSHHGDGQKPEKMAETIKFKYRREWGRSDYHFFCTSHLHHSKADTFGGMRWRQTPAVCAIGQHGNQMAFADTGGMLSMWFDTVNGRWSEFEVRL